MLSSSWMRWGLTTCALAGIGFGFVYVRSAPDERRSPELLLPANSVVYAGWDGFGAHEEAFDETAMHEALVDSGLTEVIAKFAGGLRTLAPDAEGEEIDFALSVLESFVVEGTSFSVSLPDGPAPLPTITIVLHDAAKHHEKIAGIVRQAAPVLFQKKTISGRAVEMTGIPNTPGIEVAHWVEAGHIVVVAGPNAVASAIAVAEGDAPNITEDAAWTKYRAAADDGFAVAGAGWIDFERLRGAYGEMPVPSAPPGTTVDGLLTAVGLDNLDTLSYRTGFDGPAIRTEWSIVAPGPRRGLLALAEAPAMSMDDLPPLPKDVTTFNVRSMDASAAYDGLIGVARNLVKLMPREVPRPPGFEGDPTEWLPRLAGFDVKRDLLDPLGNVSAVYFEPNGGWLGFGVTMCVSVDDSDRLANTFDALTQKLTGQFAPNELGIRRKRIAGRQQVTFEVGGGFLNPTYTVGEDWLVVGLTPQSVRSFFLRQDERLPRWQPSEEIDEALAELPKTFTSLTVSDPRPSINTLVASAPTLMGFAQGSMMQSGMPPGFQMPITVGDLPPAELVTGPLFPNVAISVTDDEGFHGISRTSLPTMPSIAGGGASAPVLVALLLPAVQQARAAARRTQSMNNMKQIGLAMHNYADTYRRFPIGTIPNADLKPEERLSWQAEILPYVEQAPVFERLDRKAAWNKGPNDELLKTKMPFYLNPGTPPGKSSYGVTHYVGIAGLGKDAPTLPVRHERAGAFGYDRELRFRDILDGTSNTMCVAEASKDFGPWGRGGASTIRALTKKPYINGPDGIGGPYTGGCNVLMLDGSVRFVSENIDAKVFEALSTINGGEIVNDF